MYGDVYYDRRKSTIRWSSYDENSNRKEYSEKWVPDFFIESNNSSEYKNQKNKPLKRIVANTFAERQRKIKEYKELDEIVYGSDLSPETKFILEKWPQTLNFTPKINTIFIDIETECENGFPIPELADERVNVVTVYSNVTDKFYTWGLNAEYSCPLTFDDPNIIYNACDTEEELLEGVVKFFENNHHDIISGWNNSGFDIPYLFNRIVRILDQVDLTEYNRLIRLIKVTKDKTLCEQYTKELKTLTKDLYWVSKLSPYQSVEKKMSMVKDQFTKEMKPIMTYAINGITDYDYMLLDQRFRMGKRDSYKLDAVAFAELGENKLQFEGSIKDFYRNDWKRFVEYNIQDVRLLTKLEQELNYINQAIALSYRCHCLFKDNYGTVKKIESAIYNFLIQDNIIMDDGEKPEMEEPIPGAYVTPKDILRRGLHKWIIDLDVSSLYPSLMRGINISYDTKIGIINAPQQIFKIQDEGTEVEFKNGKSEVFTVKEVKQFIKDNNYHVSSNNVIFENIDKKKGVLVKMLDMWYADRKKFQKEHSAFRQKAIELFNNCDDNTGTFQLKEMGVIKKVDGKTFQLYNEWMRNSNIFYNLQWSCKILLNSVYGCLASGFFRYHDRDVASAVTLSGRTIVKNNGEMINNYFNDAIFKSGVVKKNFKINEDITDHQVLLYQDTDSIYLTFDKLMNKLNVANDDKTRVKTTKFLAALAKKQLEIFNESFFPNRFNAKNSIFWEQELIAKTGIWCQPKKYVCYVLEEKGKPPKNDLLVKGLDIVRSSIPRKFREKIREAVDMILKDANKESLDAFIINTYNQFKTWTIDEIAIPVSCNNLNKFSKCNGLDFISGTPQHMRAAIAYNYYLKKFNLTMYEPIKERDKFKMTFLQKNTAYSVVVMGYNSSIPKEFDLEKYINLEAHFERAFIKPLSQIFDAIQWKFPMTKNIVCNIDNLFE